MIALGALVTSGLLLANLRSALPTQRYGSGRPRGLEETLDLRSLGTCDFSSIVDSGVHLLPYPQQLLAAQAILGSCER